MRVHNAAFLGLVVGAVAAAATARFTGDFGLAYFVLIMGVTLFPALSAAILTDYAEHPEA